MTKEAVAEWEAPPLVAVTVSIEVPCPVLELALTVSVTAPEPVIVAGANDVETPAGAPVAENVRFPLNPFSAVTVVE